MVWSEFNSLSFYLIILIVNIYINQSGEIGRHVIVKL